MPPILPNPRVPEQRHRYLAPFTPSHALPASHRSPPQAAKRSDTASAEAATDNLNRALHTVALHRRQHDPATQKYIARRVAEGKSKRDATRLLKRYLARTSTDYNNKQSRR